MTPEKSIYFRKSLNIVYATREQAFKNPKKIPESVFDTIVQEYDIVIDEYSDTLKDVDVVPHLLTCPVLRLVCPIFQPNPGQKLGCQS